MTPSPLSPRIRCVLLVGTVSGLEARRDGVLSSICYHTVGFSAAGEALTDGCALAAHLRELANVLEAPTVPDPELT